MWVSHTDTMSYVKTVNGFTYMTAYAYIGSNVLDNDIDTVHFWEEITIKVTKGEEIQDVSEGYTLCFPKYSTTRCKCI